MAELDRESFYMFLDSPSQSRIEKHIDFDNRDLTSEQVCKKVADKLDQYEMKIHELEASKFHVALLELFKKR